MFEIYCHFLNLKSNLIILVLLQYFHEVIGTLTFLEVCN